MGNKKIIYAIHRISKNGGAPRCVYELARRAKNKFQIIIVTLEVERGLKLPGVKIIKLKKPDFGGVFSILLGTMKITKECKRLKKLYGDDCIIHSHGNVSFFSDIVTCQGSFNNWG